MFRKQDQSEDEPFLGMKGADGDACKGKEDVVTGPWTHDVSASVVIHSLIPILRKILFLGFVS